MAKSLILRNITGSQTVAIPDLGIQIGIGDTLDFTSLIEKDRFLVYASVDLRAKVDAGEIEVIYNSVAVPSAELDNFLQRFCVLDHNLGNDHVGDLPESRVSDDGSNTLARIGDDEVITGSWSFPGGIVVQTGTAIPSTVLDAGSIFYDTVANELYVSNGTNWVEYASLNDLTNHTHDGIDSAKISHLNLLDVTPDLHHNQQHDINGTDHTGLLLETKIQNGTLLARVADDETIVGLYDFTNGGLIMQAGTLANRPTGAISAGRLYWATDTKSLFVSDGTIWVDFVSTADFNAHDHGANGGATVDHNDLANKGVYTHAEIDTHIDETVDPHSDEMTVSTRIITPEIQNTGDVVVDAKAPLGQESTVWFKNSGGGTLKVRIMGNFQYDGTIDQTTLFESQVVDNTIALNSNFTTGTPSSDAGIAVRRGDNDDAKLNWTEAIDRWQGGVGSNLYTFAYIEADESISGDWSFNGGIIIPRGNTLPAPGAEGGMFWKSDTNELYLSDGVNWIKFVSSTDFDAHNHDGTVGSGGIINHDYLSNVTPNQHHNQEHDINSTDHFYSGAPKLLETNIADNGVITRNAEDEVITGDWEFDGSLVIPTVNGITTEIPYQGRFILDTSNNTLQMGDGSAWITIATFGNILSATAGSGLSNSGTTTEPVFDVNVDDATIQITSDILSVKAIPESLVSKEAGVNGLVWFDDDETITGNWTFNGQLIIPVIAGSTLPSTVVNGRVLELAGTGDTYIGSNGSWEKIMTSANVSDVMRSRIQFSRHGNCNVGTFLMNGDTLTSLTQGVVLATDSILAGASVMNKNVLTDLSGVEIFKNGGAIGGVNVQNGKNFGYTNTLNVPFAAGDFVSVRLKTTNGSNLKNPQVTLEFK